jgi:hypothetical protein
MICRSFFITLAALLSIHASAASLPRTLTWEASRIAEAKKKLEAKDPALQDALAELCKEADALLDRTPPSVLDKTKVADSGNKHDYFSMGPYWWPDPSKPDGLPYIQRDGQVNPENKAGTNSAAYPRLCYNIRTLGLAYYLTGDERYAEKAATFARVWFLDPATAMTPHLQYAQAVPGKTAVRGIGIIESRHMTALVDGLALIEASPAWPDSDQDALRAWMEKFYVWLTTSANGKAEAAAKNNHGSWYDVQVVSLALYLGRSDDARAVLETARTKRIELQIEPDGRQPLELARTKSLDYCLFNLEALAQLSHLGRHVGIDLWVHRSADGRSMVEALRILAPYADPAKQWPKEDLKAADRERIPALVRQYRRFHDDESLPVPAPAVGFDF